MAVREPFPSRVRLGVPPGVGDTYWVITKLHDFRRKNLIKHVTLCVQQNTMVRALDWSKMTDLVDATEEFDFKPNREVHRHGYARNYTGLDAVLWPNAVIDRGQHLGEWLPRYELDLDFPVTVDPGDGQRHYVVYASSMGVNENWFPGRGPAFWNEVLLEVTKQTGQLPVLIGAGWDAEFAAQITAPCVNMISKTDLPQVAGIIKRARLLVGIISGMTVLGNHFRTPTVAVYPDRFMPGFLTSWIKSGTPYVPVAASMATSPAELVRTGIAIST